MKDKKSMTIYFPHVIAGNTLNGVLHDYNRINGGMKPLSDFNINPNKFMGGNCSKHIGRIKEYGFYACPHYEKRMIIAFYIHDPDMLTELGKQVIEKMYPDYSVIYAIKTPTIHAVLTEAELAKKKKLLEQIQDKGVTPELVNRASVDELESVLEAIDSGRATKAVQEVPAPKAEKVKVEHKSVPVNTKFSRK